MRKYLILMMLLCGSLISLLTYMWLYKGNINALYVACVLVGLFVILIWMYPSASEISAIKQHELSCLDAANMDRPE